MPRPWTSVFTGERLDAYMFIKDAFSRNSQDYRDALAVLQQRQRIADAAKAREAKRRAEREAAREAEKAKKAAERKAATAARQAEKKAKAKEARLIAAVPANVLIRKVNTDDVEKFVYDYWKTGVHPVQVIDVENANHIDQIEYRPKYKDYRMQYVEGEDSQGNNFWLQTGKDYLFVRPTTITPQRLVQRFRDGIQHCVFTPILMKLAERLEDATADSSKKRIRQRINTMKKLQEEYDEGVPENKMESVAKSSGFKIQIFDVLGNELAIYNKDGREGCIKMTNTRANHLDSGIVVNSDFIDLSQEDITTLWAELKAKDEFYMIEGDLKEGLPSKLLTLKGAFRLEDPNREIFEKFNEEIGLANYRINATKYPALNEFLKSGRIINGWSAKLGDGEATACADMKAAYTKFKECSEYAGFLGMVHQFRSGSFTLDFVKKNLGFYGFEILNEPIELLSTLGFERGGSYVLFGPELLFYVSLGLEVRVFQGAWGSKFDFDFNEEMCAKRRYCKWAGLLGMERSEKSFTMCASREWAEHIATEHKTYYWGRDGLLTIRKPVKAVFTAHHILGAITAYVRIQMIQAMMKFDRSQLIRVVLDGIMYKGEKPSDLPVIFSDKKAKPDWYEQKIGRKVERVQITQMPWFSEVEMPVFPLMGRITGNSVLTGQGGSGKTYSIFTDTGFHDVLFVSPSHILGQDVRNKYNANYTTINKLVGIECAAYSTEHRHPSVIFVDEITQVPAEWIEKIPSMYPQSLLLLAGDIDAEGRWFQCRSGDGDNWNRIINPTELGYAVIDFTEDRRSRDQELKDLKLKIREAMRKSFQYGDDAHLFMKAWAHKYLQFSELDFKKGDTCIASTHAYNRKLLDKGVVSGWYKKGGFVAFEEPEGYGWDKRGSFTIHSYQGKTIEDGTIWIYVDDMFEYAQLYTAVSRAVHFSQLRFLRKV